MYFYLRFLGRLELQVHFSKINKKTEVIDRDGYLPSPLPLQKPLDPEKFLATIHRALDTDRINNGFNLKEAQERYRELSPREREIIQRVSIGMSNKAVAEDLVLSERTVESHRASAYRKLKVKNVGDLQQLLSALETEEREQERSLKEMRQTKFR